MNVRAARVFALPVVAARCSTVGTEQSSSTKPKAVATSRATSDCMGAQPPRHLLTLGLNRRPSSSSCHAAVPATPEQEAPSTPACRNHQSGEIGFIMTHGVHPAV
jgi:hypothetical protein